MAKFVKDSSSAASPVQVTPPPLTSPVTDPALVVQEGLKLTKDAGGIMDDGVTTVNRDAPNTKHTDVDLAGHPALVNGARQIMTDPLTRQLNCAMYLLDVAKRWAHNPLGGRPVEINYTREFPEKKILYDSFDASPETNTREKVEKLIGFKHDLAHANGYRYLFQSPWNILTADELTKQLESEDAWLKTVTTK